MTHVDTPKQPDGPARMRALEAASRAAATRDLQDKLRRIEVLRTVAEKRFARLNRTIVFSVRWIGVLGFTFLALMWYSGDILTWLIETMGLGGDAGKAGKAK